MLNVGQISLNILYLSKWPNHRNRLQSVTLALLSLKKFNRGVIYQALPTCWPPYCPESILGADRAGVYGNDSGQVLSFPLPTVTRHTRV